MRTCRLGRCCYFDDTKECTGLHPLRSTLPPHGGERSLTRLNKVSKHKSNIDTSQDVPTNKQKDITKKVNKGGWRMPRLQEAKKDVTSCEKLRGGANDH